jgi:hypothetical protein
MTYWCFVNWKPANLADVLNSKIPLALEEYDNGNKKPFLDMKIATTDPFYKSGGWCFDLRPYLRRYWVKTKYYGIQEYYAINKTAIRNELKSNCLEIAEI